MFFHKYPRGFTNVRSERGYYIGISKYELPVVLVMMHVYTWSSYAPMHRHVPKYD